MGATAFATAEVVGAGASIWSSYQSSKKKPDPSVPVLPTMPNADEDAANAANSAALAAQRQRKRAAAGSMASQTILTGPQGVNAPAPAQKTLLGQ